VAELAVQISHRRVVDDRDRNLAKIIEAVERVQDFARERGDVAPVARLSRDFDLRQERFSARS
jgi:hypothetical protein